MTKPIIALLYDFDKTPVSYTHLLSGAKNVTAKASGTYSAACDGYETVLTEAFLEDVTPAKLKAVKAAAEPSNVGKLIYGDKWYYAVTLPEAQAAQLKTLGRINVRLAKGLSLIHI